MNGKRLLATIGSASAALGLALTLVLTMGIGGRGAPPAKLKNADLRPAPVAQESAVPPASAEGGLGQGINVHGNWTIDVLNEDGSMAERREFTNALMNTGQVLAQFLSRSKTVGKWGIVTANQSMPDSPCMVQGQPVICQIWEGNPPPFGGPAQVSNNLKTAMVNHFTPFDPPAKVVLQGSITAYKDGVLNYVQTLNSLCPNNVNPLAAGQTACEAGHAVSLKELPPSMAVNVLASQTVMVKVEFTFS